MAKAHRRSARGFALQVLYARDVDPSVAVDSAVTGWPESFRLDVDPEAAAFSAELVNGVVLHAVRVDDLITAASRNWRLERMGRVDRNILRLGVAEMLHFPNTPVGVVINEAVELAKRYGTGDSSAFVNGVLDRVATALGRQAPADTE